MRPPQPDRLRHVVVLCPQGNAYAQAVAEAIFAAGALAADVTVIQGDLALPAADDRQGAGLTLVDLSGLRPAGDVNARWRRDVAARLEHACEAGGDILVLLALFVEPAGAPRARAADLAALRFVDEVASRFPSLRIDAVSLGRDVVPRACAQRLISALDEVETA